MRASVSTVDFRRGALGFSVFGALCGLRFFPLCRIWWHLVLEQIIQTFMEQHQLLGFFFFFFFFSIWALFHTLVTNGFLIMKKILDRRLKCAPRPYRPEKVHSFTFRFHISIVSKRTTFKLEQMKDRPIDLLKAKTNACTLQDYLGVSRPFVSDTSPKSIDREGLGRRRIGTRESFR